MRHVLALGLLVAGFAPIHAGNLTALKIYSDATWNCAGDHPPCFNCASRVNTGDGQSPYGCAPFVSHCLAAGGFIPVHQCGGMDEYGAVQFGGQTYDLNVVAKQDSNCGGGVCLTDYLLARGWKETSNVRLGTVCAVVGSDGPYTHTVIGVGDGIVNAHNVAEYHLSISHYQTNLCLDPPQSEVVY